MKTQRWPIDFDSLRIGTRVTVGDIEIAFGVKRDDVNYRLKQLALVEMIRKQRPDLDPYVRSNMFDIIIMNDSEAARHQRSRFSITAKQTLTAHRRTMGVDATKLEPSEGLEHERALYVNGRIVSSIMKTRDDIQLEAVQRKTPLMGKDED